MKPILFTQYRIIRYVDDLPEIEAAWRGLLSEEAAPFSTYTWNAEWLRAFALEYDSLQVFVFSVDEEVRAIVPLYRKGNELRFAGDLHCDYQTVIARSDESARAAMQNVIQHAAENGLTLQAPKISSETSTYRALTSVEVRALPVCSYRRHYCPVPFMKLDDDWEEFQKTLSKNLRSDVRRRRNRMKRELDHVTTNVFKGAEISRNALAMIGDLHVANQFRKQGESLFSDPRFVRFLQRIAQHREVGLHLALLSADGRPMAFTLGFHRGGTYYLYLTAYDDGFERFSPGKVLVFELVQRLVEGRDTKIFDFLNGPEGYKYQWATSEYDVYEFEIRPRSAVNYVRATAKGLKDRARKRAKEALVSAGLYETAAH